MPRTMVASAQRGHPGPLADHRFAALRIVRRSSETITGITFRRCVSGREPEVRLRRASGGVSGRGNAICPDTSSRSHSIAVESQNPGTAYHRYSPPGHQAQYFLRLNRRLNRLRREQRVIGRTTRSGPASGVPPGGPGGGKASKQCLSSLHLFHRVPPVPRPLSVHLLDWWSGEIGATKKTTKLVQGFLRYIRSTTIHATGDGAVELVSREIVEFS